MMGVTVTIGVHGPWSPLPPNLQLLNSPKRATIPPLLEGQTEIDPEDDSVDQLWLAI